MWLCDWSKPKNMVRKKVYTVYGLKTYTSYFGSGCRVEILVLTCIRLQVYFWQNTLLHHLTESQKNQINCEEQ